MTEVLPDNRPWFIYALGDPRNRAVRYVGWAGNPFQRHRGHIATARRTRKPRHYSTRWIKQLLADDLLPTVTILESGVGNGWADAERRWIAHYRTQGARLTNMTDGGEGMRGYRFSAESRAKMAAAKKGRRQTPEAIEATHAHLRGRKRPIEVVQRALAVRAARGFYRPTIEHRALMRALYLGTTRSVEVRARIAAGMRGRPLTDEWKQRIGDANRGRKPAPQAIAASVAVRLGVPLSAEHKAKIGAASRGRSMTDEQRARIAAGRRATAETRKPQACGLCRAPGHYRSTCPERSDPVR